MEKSHIFCFLICVLLLLPLFDGGLLIVKAEGTEDGSELWGYVPVRPGAQMFWWMYKSPNRPQDLTKSWPIILWLQGGPGSSGVGIGNFQEIGPLDTQLQNRSSTWLKMADLLFVDSPVGTGYSYVHDKRLLVNTDEEAAADLLTLSIEVFNNYVSSQESPLYIVAESYGGRHAVILGSLALKAIEDGTLKLNLGGVVLGDAWISPLDYVLSWGPLLYAVSRLGNNGLHSSISLANHIKEQIEGGDFYNASNTWVGLAEDITAKSNGVNFYNFMLDDGINILSSGNKNNLSYLMNVEIREKLNIIPKNVTWVEESEDVFGAFQGDFMRPRIKEVGELLSSGVNVTIYNGQLDVVCSTMGTEAWVENLKWDGLKAFLDVPRIPKSCGKNNNTKGFLRSYKNLNFYWILRAGHYVLLNSLVWQ